MSSLRLLIDNALSPNIVAELKQAGHDVVHVRSLSMGAASDREILERALRDSRIVVTRDSDFAQLLAVTGARQPSVVVLRGSLTVRPADQAATVRKFLPEAAADLLAGAVMVLDGTSPRVRTLPFR